MNKLVVIGWMGIRICYLNIPLQEAIDRFLITEGMSLEDFNKTEVRYEVIEFDDEFGAYEVWGLD
jgi:hypothetical protein